MSMAAFQYKFTKTGRLDLDNELQYANPWRRKVTLTFNLSVIIL